MTDAPAPTRAVTATPGDRLVDRALRDISRTERTMRRFNGRLNTLQLLGDISDGQGRVVRMSQREWRDHPQVQLLLERRDRYNACQSHAATARERLGDAELRGDDFLRALEAIGRIEAEGARHLQAMEICLSGLRKELATYLNTLAKLVADFAKIHQSYRIHREKLEAGDDSDIDDLDDAELDG